MRYPVLMAAALALASCGGRKEPGGIPTAAQTDTAAADSAKTPKQYFPVFDFLKSEIAYVDSLPVGIKKFTGNKRGSHYVYIKPGEFHRLAKEFTPPSMNDQMLQQKYRETSFFDKSSNVATFFYNTTDTSLAIQRIDVLTIKGDVYDQVKSIYMQKSYRLGDTAVTQKLYWKPKRSFQIITETTRGTQQPGTEIVDVIWDNHDEP